MERETDPAELFVSKEEFAALNKCNPKVRYDYTLKRIADTEIIWIIADEENNPVIQLFQDQKLFPIWSAREYAEAFREGESEDMECIAISLETFEEYVIDFIESQNLQINVFPTKLEPGGKIVSLETFTEDLNSYLELYE